MTPTLSVLCQKYMKIKKVWEEKTRKILDGADSKDQSEDVEEKINQQNPQEENSKEQGLQEGGASPEAPLKVSAAEETPKKKRMIKKIVKKLVVKSKNGQIVDGEKAARAISQHMAKLKRESSKEEGNQENKEKTQEDKAEVLKEESIVQIQEEKVEEAMEMAEDDRKEEKMNESHDEEEKNEDEGPKEEPLEAPGDTEVEKEQVLEKQDGVEQSMTVDDAGKDLEMAEFKPEVKVTHETPTSESSFDSSILNSADLATPSENRKKRVIVKRVIKKGSSKGLEINEGSLGSSEEVIMANGKKVKVIRKRIIKRKSNTANEESPEKVPKVTEDSKENKINDDAKDSLDKTSKEGESQLTPPQRKKITFGPILMRPRLPKQPEVPTSQSEDDQGSSDANMEISMEKVAQDDPTMTKETTARGLRLKRSKLEH